MEGGGVYLDPGQIGEELLVLQLLLLVPGTLLRVVAQHGHRLGVLGTHGGRLLLHKLALRLQGLAAHLPRPDTAHLLYT